MRLCAKKVMGWSSEAGGSAESWSLEAAAAFMLSVAGKTGGWVPESLRAEAGFVLVVAGETGGWEPGSSRAGAAFVSLIVVGKVGKAGGWVSSFRSSRAAQQLLSRGRRAGFGTRLPASNG